MPIHRRTKNGKPLLTCETLMTTCTIEHHRDGERIARWNVTERMIQRDGHLARVVFPVGHIVLASYDELHFCLPDGVRVLSEVQQR